MQERNIQTGRKVDHLEIINLPLTVHEAAWVRDGLDAAGNDRQLNQTNPGLAAWYRSFARGLQAKIDFIVTSR